MAEANAVETSSRNHPAIGGLPLVLGGNVFGWTIDRDAGFAVLDAFYEAGGRMIDTAEGYSNWVPGNKGGESEAILGEWMQSRGVRAEMRIATKTGQGLKPGMLEPARVRAALAGSLDRLRTDYVDLYYAHRDDAATPLEDVVGVYDELFRGGQARELGASNYTTARLREALDIAARNGARGFTVMQPLYNLVARSEFEGELQDLCVARGVAVLPYYGLASGFLSGKYRSADDWAGSTRAQALDRAGQGGGWERLQALRDIATRLGVLPAQVALAWLTTRAAIAAPIASATSPAQVAELTGAARIVLDEAALEQLNAPLAG